MNCWCSSSTAPNAATDATTISAPRVDGSASARADNHASTAYIVTCTSLSAPVGDADASGAGMGMDVAMRMSEAQPMAGPKR